MKFVTRRIEISRSGLLVLAAIILGTVLSVQGEQRNEVSNLRGKYNTVLFWRHNETFQNGTAIHFAHAVQHDILELTPISNAADENAEIPGYGRRLDADTTIIADFTREQEIEKHKEANIFELGVRRRITLLTLITAGLGAGVGSNSPQFCATPGSQ